MVLQTTVCSLNKEYNYSKRQWFFSKQHNFISRSTEWCHLCLARLTKFSFRQALGKLPAFAYLRMIRRDRIQPNKKKWKACTRDRRQAARRRSQNRHCQKRWQISLIGKRRNGIYHRGAEAPRSLHLSALWFLLPRTRSQRAKAQPCRGKRDGSSALRSWPTSPVTLLMEKAKKGKVKKDSVLGHSNLYCRVTWASSRSQEIITFLKEEGIFVGLS